jgi:hypothetical protein
MAASRKFVLVKWRGEPIRKDKVRRQLCPGLEDEENSRCGECHEDTRQDQQHDRLLRSGSREWEYMSRDVETGSSQMT